MNGTQQKAHHTAVSALENATAEAIEGLVEAVENERQTRAAEDTRLTTDIGIERTHRLELAEQQRNYVDAADRRLDRIIEAETFDRRAFVGRGFWSRLNWLFTGR